MGEGGGTGTGAAKETRFDRISLEDFAVLDVDRKPEHYERGRIRIKSGIWNQHTLHIRYKSESRKIILKESSGVEAINPDSRENFLAAANMFLEEHDMYLTNAIYIPASVGTLFSHTIEGDLHQRSSAYTNKLGW